MTPDLLPGERWCRMCHRLEREVVMYGGEGHGAVCRECYFAAQALWRYWRRYWRKQQQKRRDKFTQRWRDVAAIVEQAVAA